MDAAAIATLVESKVAFLPACDVPIIRKRTVPALLGSFSCLTSHDALLPGCFPAIVGWLREVVDRGGLLQ